MSRFRGDVSLFRRSKSAHSLRSKILPLSIKKNHQKILKMKKSGASFRFFFAIFEIFENFENIEIFSISL